MEHRNKGVDVVRSLSRPVYYLHEKHTDQSNVESLVQLKSGNANLDHRFVEAVSVLVQPVQGSAREKAKLIDLILLERIGEVRHPQICLSMSAQPLLVARQCYIGVHLLK